MRYFDGRYKHTYIAQNDGGRKLANSKQFARVFIPIQIYTFKDFAPFQLQHWLLQVHAPFHRTCDDSKWQLWIIKLCVKDRLFKGFSGLFYRQRKGEFVVIQQVFLSPMFIFPQLAKFFPARFLNSQIGQRVFPRYHFALYVKCEYIFIE